jgi:hypothetical protein
MFHGPITLKQHRLVVQLSDYWVRTHGYCWLVYWVPDHPLHTPACRV